MQIGKLYLPLDRMKFKNEKISQFERHVYCKKGKRLVDWTSDACRYPINADYVTIAYGRYEDLDKSPLIYLGYTMENWWLPRADWFPIRKRHWCMYKGRKMILDAWSAKHIKALED